MSIEPSNTVYMAASQHTFNFSLSELLLIKKLRHEKVLTCSQLGGCESISIYEKLTYLSLMRSNAVTWSHLLLTKN